MGMILALVIGSTKLDFPIPIFLKPRQYLESSPVPQTCLHCSVASFPFANLMVIVQLNPIFYFLVLFCA